MMFSNPFKKPEVKYDELEGQAQEAAKVALKGEVREFGAQDVSDMPQEMDTFLPDL